MNHKKRKREDEGIVEYMRQIRNLTPGKCNLEYLAPTEESIVRRNRTSRSICREMQRGRDSDRLLATCDEALEGLQTEVVPLSKYGLSRIYQLSDVGNGAKKERREWRREI